MGWASLWRSTRASPRRLTLVKHYDEPATAYQRLIARGELDSLERQRPESRRLATNPAERQRHIDRLLRQLWRLGASETKIAEDAG